jgi:hypothetical protein
VITLIPPKVFSGGEFGDFRGESRPSSRAAAADLSQSSLDPFDRHTADSTAAPGAGSDRRAPSPSSHDTPNEGLSPP